MMIDDWASSSSILKMRFFGHPVEHNIRSNTSIGLLQRESETYWKDYLQSYDDDLVLLILDQWKGYTCCRIPSTEADIASSYTISTFPSLWQSSPPRKNIAWCSYSSSWGSADALVGCCRILLSPHHGDITSLHSIARTSANWRYPPRHLCCIQDYRVRHWQSNIATSRVRDKLQLCNILLWLRPNTP